MCAIHVAFLLPFSSLLSCCVFFLFFIINFPAHICSHTLLQHFCNTPAHSYLFSLNTLTTTTSSCLNWGTCTESTQYWHRPSTFAKGSRSGLPGLFSSPSLFSLAFHKPKAFSIRSRPRIPRDSRGLTERVAARGAVGDDTTPFHSTDGHKEKERKKETK